MSFKKAVTKASGVKVHQINKDTNKVIKTFDSISDAVRHLGKTSTTCISKVCNGKSLTAFGYKWQKA
jgi:hypothetical protein